MTNIHDIAELVEEQEIIVDTQEVEQIIDHLIINGGN